MKLIPITYHNKKYPEGIISDIDEIAGNLDKEKIEPSRKYSLHTEYSHMKRMLDNDLINKYPVLKNSHKDNVPSLWYSDEWAVEFAHFTIDLVGNNESPTIIEIHPPFKEYCDTFTEFFSRYELFEKIILEKFPNVKILIENRCGTFYPRGKFLISKGDTIIQFLKELSERDLKLRLVLDYPQVFSAELIKLDDMKLNKIVAFNKSIKPYIEYIDGFHLWGKRKSPKGRWVPHTGDLNDFFSNNQELKEEFILSVKDTFSDEKHRFFVPEVNSGDSDLQSIIKDLLKYDIIFVSEI